MTLACTRVHYYERGVQPLLPIDTVAALQSAGIREEDLAPVQVLERVNFLHDLHMVVRDAIVEAELKITYYANQKREHAENFKIGELVRLSLDGVELNKFKYRPSKKLNPIWYGPYRVIGRPSSISCELADLQDDCYITTVFPMSKLKLASDEQFSKKEKCKNVQRKMYYVKWKGYSEIYDSTWEPREHLEGTQILTDYEKRHNLAILFQGGCKSVQPRLLDQSKTRKKRKIS